MLCSSIRDRTAGDSRVRPSASLPPPCVEGASLPPPCGEGWGGGTATSLSLPFWGAPGEGAGSLPLVGRAGEGVAAPTASSITAISVPTVTVVPSLTLISLSTPASGAGTSALTLSVITSTSPSYFLT